MKKSNLQPISIAVLPFKNISSSQDLSHFVDGFTEDLITDLSRYSSLRVISKHSTQLINEKESYWNELVSALNADYLVKGSFRQKGNSIRVNAQLIHAQHETIVWSNRHDADIEEIFDLLDELVEQLVSTLHQKVNLKQA